MTLRVVQLSAMHKGRSLGLINDFNRDYLKPHFPRPCFCPEVIVDAKGAL
ncbi:MAG: hypothetical protein ACHBMF_08830 [Chromatiales bacterium]